MEVLLMLFGALLVFGLPLAGLITSLVNASRMSDAQRRLLDLESELSAQSARVARAERTVEALQRALAATRVAPAAAAVPAPAPVAAAVAGAVADPVAAAVAAAAPALPALVGPSAAPADPVATPAAQPETVPAEAVVPTSAPQPAPAPRAPYLPRPQPAAAGGPTPARPRAPLPDAADEGPPPRPTLTLDWIITRLAAGLGGFSLLLGAIFALSAAIEKGWLGPGLRVGAGLALGTVLVVRGALMRAKGLSWSGAALVGSGQGILYGSIFAAASLYHLLPQAAAFGALAVLTVLGMALADRLRDPVSAVLSLIGGLLTPVLLSTGENNALGLFSYLALLTGGMSFVAVRRGWWPLLLAAGLGALALDLGWTVRYRAPDQLPAAALALLSLAAPSLATGALLGRRPDRPGAAGLERVAFFLLLLIGLCGLPWVVPIDPQFVDPITYQTVFRQLGAAPWWSFGLLVGLSAAPLLLARRASVGPLGGLSLALSTLLLLAFSQGHAGTAGDHRLQLVAAQALLLLPALGLRGSAGGFVGSAAPLALGLVNAIFLATIEVPPAGFTALWMASPALLALALGRRAPAGPLAAVGGVAVVGLVAAGRLGQLPAGEVLGAAALAVGLLGSWPLAWPIQPGATGRLHLQAASLAAPAVAAPALLAWMELFGDGARGLVPLLLALMPLLGTIVMVRVHRLHRGSGLLAFFFGVTLLGLTAAVPLQLKDQWLTLTWALEGAALALLARRLTHPLVPWSSFLLGMVVAVRLVMNPYALEYGNTDGLPFLNWTLYTWGLPLVCLLASAKWLGPSLRADASERAAALPAGARGAMVLAAVAVGFALVNVQVSDVFQDAGPVELGGHGLLQGMVRSLAWALYGMVVLSVGIAREQRVLRFVGFGLVLLAAAKVFVVDLWSLSGFIRVGSIMGLGATLLAAAFLFERLVLRRQAAEAAEDAEAAAHRAAARAAAAGGGEPPEAAPEEGAP